MTGTAPKVPDGPLPGKAGSKAIEQGAVKRFGLEFLADPADILFRYRVVARLQGVDGVDNKLRWARVEGCRLTSWASRLWSRGPLPEQQVGDRPFPSPVDERNRREIKGRVRNDHRPQLVPPRVDAAKYQSRHSSLLYPR